MAENKQEPRQIREPGHGDRMDGHAETGSKRREDEEREWDRERIKLAVVKWRMSALCETSEVGKKREALLRHQWFDAAL